MTEVTAEEENGEGTAAAWLGAGHGLVAGSTRGPVAPGHPEGSAVAPGVGHGQLTTPGRLSVPIPVPAIGLDHTMPVVVGSLPPDKDGGKGRLLDDSPALAAPVRQGAPAQPQPPPQPQPQHSPLSRIFGGPGSGSGGGPKEAMVLPRPPSRVLDAPGLAAIRIARPASNKEPEPEELPAGSAESHGPLGPLSPDTRSLSPGLMDGPVGHGSGKATEDGRRSMLSTTLVARATRLLHGGFHQ